MASVLTRKPSAKPSRLINGVEWDTKDGVIYRKFGDKWHPYPYTSILASKCGYEQAEKMLDMLQARAVLDRLGVR